MPELPHRDPGTAKQRHDRLDQLDAVLAQCSISESYAAGRLAAYEAELSDLLPIALQLDDGAPADTD